jgi:hypothetical protein
MTEQEWLECDDALKILRICEPTGEDWDSEEVEKWTEQMASDRKLRLFALACCHWIRHLLSDVRSSKALDVLEQYLLGSVPESEFRAAHKDAYSALPRERSTPHKPDWYAALAVSYATYPYATGIHDAAWSALAALTQAHRASSDVVKQERAVQRALLSDVFGNPFRPVTLNPAWLTPTVKQLAQSIYDDKVFDRLPTVADALEDSGCDNADVLGHCRSGGEHVRGCWVVDLVLEKE